MPRKPTAPTTAAVADKVLPFRPSTGHTPEEAGEGRVAEAWGALQAAEQVGRSRRVLQELEERYLAELKALSAMVAQPPATVITPRGS
jgi:hypothetical protein